MLSQNQVPSLETLKETYQKVKEECGDLIVEIFKANLDSKMNNELISMLGQMCSAIDTTLASDNPLLWPLAVNIAVKFKPVLEVELRVAQEKAGTFLRPSLALLTPLETDSFVKLLRDNSTAAIERVETLCQTDGALGATYRFLRDTFSYVRK